MKTIFKISLAANVVLAMLVLWQVRSHSGAAAQVPAPSEPEPPAGPSAATVTPPPTAATETQAGFRWSQLASSDYRVFIQNLRNIECPGPVIRAIVSADVDSAFVFQRRQLGVSELETGPWSRQSEGRLIARLLGDAVPMADSASAQPAVSPENPRAIPQREVGPSVPLVFQSVDLSQLNLTDAQKDTIAQLQQQFTDEIGGTNQDPNDPAYLARWQAAQPMIDQLSLGRLGNSLYIKLRMLANGVPASAFQAANP